VVSGNKQTVHVSNTIFLGIVIDNSLSWKLHIEEIVPKLSAACYAIRSVKPYISPETMKMVYFSYLNSSMTYGLIFWGNPAYNVKIFGYKKCS
jgi:hypothetical protein